jgi:PST family polysaccharide transporter
VKLAARQHEKLFTARNAIMWGFGEKALLAVVNGLTSTLMVRALGPISYGEWSAAIAVWGLTLPLASLGQAAAIKVVSECKGGQARATLLSLLPAVAGALIGAALMCTLAIWIGLGKNTSVYLVVLAVSLVLRPLALLDSWFLGTLRAAVAAKTRVVAFMFVALLRGATLYFGGPASAYAGLVLVESFLTGAALAASFVRLSNIREERKRSRAESVALVQYLLKSGLPLMLTSFSAFVYMRSDQILLSLTSSMHEVGIYSACTSVSELSFMAPVVLVNVITPYILRRRQMQGEARFSDDVCLLWAALGIMGWIACLGLVLSADVIADRILGPGYEHAGEILRILAVSSPLVFLGVGQTVVAVVRKEETLMALRVAIAAGANVLANLWVVPRYGAYGAAVTTVIAQLVGVILAGLLWTRTRRHSMLALRSLDPGYCLLLLWRHRTGIRDLGGVRST